MNPSDAHTDPAGLLAAALSRIPSPGAIGDCHSQVSLLIWRIGDPFKQAPEYRFAPRAAEHAMEDIEKGEGDFIEIWEGCLADREGPLYLKLLGRISRSLASCYEAEVTFHDCSVPGEWESLQRPAICAPSAFANDVNAAPSSSPFDELSPRQREVARYIGMGMTNREIAEKIYVSPKTVEYHLGIVYQKFSVSNRQQLREIVQNMAR
ncbi:LuxR C-terminal-related transcriptional regulator [Bacillus subtilis]